MTKEICPECNGDGWVVGSTAAHAGDSSCRMGECRNCPVQEQTQEGCDFCGGEGTIDHDALGAILDKVK